MRRFLAIAIGSFCLLAGCKSTEGLKLSVSAVGGVFSDFNVGAIESDGGSIKGVSLRLGQNSEAFPSFYLGVRIDGTVKETDGADAGATFDYESNELAGAIEVRWNIPVGKEPSIQPFIDIFAGYAHNWSDITRTAGAITATDTDSSGGPWGGAGAGFEFALSDNVSLQLGAEYITADYDIAGIDIDERRTQGFFGMIYTF